MNFMIDNSGSLHLGRAGKWILTECMHDKTTSCNHACPHFAEPYTDNGVSSIELTCGHGVTFAYHGTIISDERGKA